jgi:1,4-dihydroxy-2-naphthoate octaprenyltransferase
MLKNFIRFSHPLNLLLGGLTYTLGTGIARYLGETTTLTIFWLGLIGVISGQLGMNLLGEAFRPFTEPVPEELTRAERETLRNTLTLSSIGALAGAGLIAYLLLKEGALSPQTILFLGLSLAIVVAYAVPPLRLLDKGYGEFAFAVHLAFISPALGFIFQAGVYHRLVGIVSFPLTFMALAYFLVLGFPSFASDQKYDRRTLLRILGWERAVPLHHFLLLASYLLLASAYFFGVAWELLWQAFLTIPFALFQVWQLHNISLGGRPVWRLLMINSLAVFGLTAYLLTFAFWLR